MRVVPALLAFALAVAATAAAQDMSHQHGSDDDQAPDGRRGHGHAQNHDWYKELKQPGTNYSCCNGDVTQGDCRPARAYRESDGTWRALVDGHWQPACRPASSCRRSLPTAIHISARERAA